MVQCAVKAWPHCLLGFIKITLASPRALVVVLELANMFFLGNILYIYNKSLYRRFPILLFFLQLPRAAVLGGGGGGGRGSTVIIFKLCTTSL